VIVAFGFEAGVAVVGYFAVDLILLAIDLWPRRETAADISKPPRNSVTVAGKT
jgi:hypothetical protein